LPFNAVADHQIDALVRSESFTGNYWKIPDTAAINGYTSPKPYDCQIIIGAKAYVCPCWYVPRIRKTFYKIRIQDWLDLRDRVERKSITEDMAVSISSEVIQL